MLTNPEALNAFIKASETYSLIASQDIVDIDGFKLWAKGRHVSSELQQRLLDRKLQKPLEVCLVPENGVDRDTVLRDLLAFFEEDAILPVALKPWAAALVEQVEKIDLHPVAQLLLTTALATRPDSYFHAISAMALAGAMCMDRGNQADVISAMLAGLLHDVGEIYIQPQYLADGDTLDYVGHKHLVVHPRVAQLLLRSTTEYSDAVCRAIGEHHERMNGSGYPARLLHNQISSLGRLLAVVEVSVGILRRPVTSLTRATFALRIVPGEFDQDWANFVWKLGRLYTVDLDKEIVPDLTLSLLQLGAIDKQIQRVLDMAARLESRERSALYLEIIGTTRSRLTGLRVAWNALGGWGIGSIGIGITEALELELIRTEMLQRFTSIQREAMLLSERLDASERELLTPIWDGLINPAVNRHAVRAMQDVDQLEAKGLLI